MLPQDFSIKPGHIHYSKQDESNNKKVQSNWNGKTVVVITVIAAVVFVASSLVIVAKLVAHFAKSKIHGEKEYYEQLIKQKYAPGTLDMIPKLEEHNLHPTRVMHRLALAEDEEIRILRHLNQNYHLTPLELAKILKGANVILQDGGEAYREWMSFENVEEGPSSHPSLGKQFRMQGKMVSELLFAETVDGGHTWFQLERNPICDFPSFIAHMMDYFKYKLSGENQGPEGSSEHTDKKPLVLVAKQVKPDNIV